MKLRALVHDPDSVERFLRHQGLCSSPREPAPAHALPDPARVWSRSQERPPEDPSSCASLRAPGA